MQIWRECINILGVVMVICLIFNNLVFWPYARDLLIWLILRCIGYWDHTLWLLLQIRHTAAHKGMQLDYCQIWSDLCVQSCYCVRIFQNIGSSASLVALSRPVVCGCRFSGIGEVTVASHSLMAIYIVYVMSRIFRV